MFQNSAQLNKAMKEILEIFSKGKDIDSIYPKYPDELVPDLVEALEACLSKGYLTGVSYQVGAQGDVVISVPNPHVTASGHEFLSEN